MRNVRRFSHPSFAAPLVVALALTACRGDGDTRVGDTKVSFGGDSSAAIRLGDGDVMVKSTDGAFIMAVVGDSVRMQLSDSLRNAVARDVAAKGNDSGFGAMITRSVSGIVGKAMGFSIRVPVENVQNLRYENGHINFESKGGQMNVSSGSRRDGARGATFTEADAKRFIDAVHARQRAKGVAM